MVLSKRPPKSSPMVNPKNLMYKAQFLMKNWDDADVQWNVSLGNYEQLEKYAQQKIEEDYAAKKGTKPMKAMGLIEMSEGVQVIDVIPEPQSPLEKKEDPTEGLSKEELKAFHKEKGGVVLEDGEYNRYKFYLELLAAEQMFDASFPMVAHTTEEFAEIYKEREILVKELEKFR